MANVIANAGKVSAAELTESKIFSYRTVAYFSILRYCIKTNFFKCYIGMGPLSLYQML